MVNWNMVPCRWCGTSTRMTATKMCDNCWEMDGRIRDYPELAGKMMAHYHPDLVKEAPEKRPDRFYLELEAEELGWLSAKVAPSGNELRGGAGYSQIRLSLETKCREALTDQIVRYNKKL